MAEEGAAKAAPTEAVVSKPMSKHELSDRFSRLEKRLLEYSKTPGAVTPSPLAGPGAKGSKPAPAQQPQGDYVSLRIQRPNGSGTNQFRSGIKPGVAKGGAAAVRWEAVEEAAPPGGAEPASRVGMTMTPLGAGHLSRLVLFGGAVAPTADNPHGGLASPHVSLFDPRRMRWCTDEERGGVKGRAPAPRVGHTASPVGRHLMLLFGGRTDSGLASDLHALSQYRCKAKSDSSPASFLLWSAPGWARRRTRRRARTTRRRRWAIR